MGEAKNSVNTNDIYNAIIGISGILFIGSGIVTIRRKGGLYKQKELRQAGYILAIGRIISGCVALGYLIYVLGVEK